MTFGSMSAVVGVFRLTCAFQLLPQSVCQHTGGFRGANTVKLPLPDALDIICLCLFVSSEMETAAPGPQFIHRPQVKAPGRKRRRPPIRRLQFQGYCIEPLLSHKALKKRGRKTALKVGELLLCCFTPQA